MKFTVKKKATYHFTIDSSEAVMFDQGGQHKLLIEDKEAINELSKVDQVEIIFQIHPGEMGRYKFVSSKT